MTKNQKIILFGALGVFIGLAALIIVLIVQNARHTNTANQLQEQADSLRFENDRLELANLTSEFDRLNSELSQYEDRELNIKNDSLVQQYNEAKERVNSLIAELDKEKKSNKANREKIKQLEAEITTLKGIAKHYLEEIRRLNEENEGLRQELSTQTERANNLAQENESVSRNNAALKKDLDIAKKLNISGLSLHMYGKNDKEEKKISSKTKKLGVTFTVTANNAAAPGNKNFYVRILSPEGNLLGSGPSFIYDGSNLTSTAMRSGEYANKDLPMQIYWSVNTTLTPGEYTVEVFADGNRLGTGRFNLKK